MLKINLENNNKKYTVNISEKEVLSIDFLFLEDLACTFQYSPPLYRRLQKLQRKFSECDTCFLTVKSKKGNNPILKFSLDTYNIKLLKENGIIIFDILAQEV